MATATTYHLGGYQAAAVAQNRAEQYDGAAGTYTRWDTSGTQVEQRALTAQESSALAAQAAQETADSNAQTLRQQAAAALAANRTFIAAAKPGTAAGQASAAYDQARALSQQNNKIMRLLLNQLDGTD